MAYFGVYSGPSLCCHCIVYKISHFHADLVPCARLTGSMRSVAHCGHNVLNVRSLCAVDGVYALRRSLSFQRVETNGRNYIKVDARCRACCTPPCEKYTSAVRTSLARRLKPQRTALAVDCRMAWPPRRSVAPSFRRHSTLVKGRHRSVSSRPLIEPCIHVLLPLSATQMSGGARSRSCAE